MYSIGVQIAEDSCSINEATLEGKQTKTTVEGVQVCTKTATVSIAVQC